MKRHACVLTVIGLLLGAGSRAAAQSPVAPPQAAAVLDPSTPRVVLAAGEVRHTLDIGAQAVVALESPAVSLCGGDPGGLFGTAGDWRIRRRVHVMVGHAPGGPRPVGAQRWAGRADPAGAGLRGLRRLAARAAAAAVGRRGGDAGVRRDRPRVARGRARRGGVGRRRPVSRSPIGIGMRACRARRAIHPLTRVAARAIGVAVIATMASAVPASAQAPAETIEYYAHDAIGSVRVVYDASGTVLGRQDYGPFGQIVFPVPAMPKEGFGAQEKDDETDQSVLPRAACFRRGRDGSRGRIRCLEAYSRRRVGIDMRTPRTDRSPARTSAACRLLRPARGLAAIRIIAVRAIHPLFRVKAVAFRQPAIATAAVMKAGILGTPETTGTTTAVMVTVEQFHRHRHRHRHRHQLARVTPKPLAIGLAAYQLTPRCFSIGYMA